MVSFGRRPKGNAEADPSAFGLFDAPYGPGQAAPGGPSSASSEPVVLGCHGGAGATTVAALLETPWDLGCYSPDMTEVATFGRPLVLVARDSAPASARAVEAVNGLTAMGTVAAALVIVADGSGPEPREATVRLKLIEGRVRTIVRLPFVAGLRYADAGDAGRVEPSKKSARALADIRSACAAVSSLAAGPPIGRM